MRGGWYDLLSERNVERDELYICAKGWCVPSFPPFTDCFVPGHHYNNGI